MRVGDTVRLKKGKKRARIVLFYEDIPGGVRLDRELSGFVSWNVEDLELVQVSE